MNILQITFLLYVLVLLVIGGYFFFTRETSRISSYMLADREIGFFPMAVSEAASVASGWTFLAWVGFGFSTGLGGLVFSFFFLIMVLFLYLVMGKRFRRESEALQSLTITDHLSEYFRGEWISIMIRVVGSLAIVVFFGVYVGSQLKSVGEALRASMDFQYTHGVVLGGVAIAVYTALGGFRASVWTDVLQGVMVFLAAMILPWVAISEVGGWNALLTQAHEIDPTLIKLTSGKGGVELLLWVLMWCTFAFGVIGQPHSLMRFQSIRSESDILAATGVAFVFQAIRMTLPLLIGISARVLYESVGNPEQVVFMVMTDYLPPAVAGILLAGIISAIISTTDSMILVASTDVIQAIKKSAASVSERMLVQVGRTVVVCFSGLGIALALYSDESIYQLIKFAFSGLGATFGLPLLLLLYWNGITGTGVIAGMFAGLISSFLNHYFILTSYYPVLVWPVTLGTIILASLYLPGAEPRVPFDDHSKGSLLSFFGTSDSNR